MTPKPHLQTQPTTPLKFNMEPKKAANWNPEHHLPSTSIFQGSMLNFRGVTFLLPQVTVVIKAFNPEVLL